MEEENKALIEISIAQQALDKANDIHEILDLRDKAMAMQIFATAQGFEEAAQKAKIYQLKAERKAGKWLDENVHAGNPQLSQDAIIGTLPEGINKDESSRWQQEAKVSDEVFTTWVDECLEKGKEITASGLQRMASNTHISDDSYEWNTPGEYIEAARTLMGSIDTDPATNLEANQIIKASKIYTLKEDGLKHSWLGNVWLNPPYNMPIIEQFIDKAIFEYQNEHINNAVILTNNSTDTNWFHKLLTYPVCLTKGRIKFWNGDKSLATRQGQALFYLGGNVATFADIFNNFGVVLTRL